MDEDRKWEIATFRFGVISDFVVSHDLERRERERLLLDKTNRLLDDSLLASDEDLSVDPF